MTNWPEGLTLRSIGVAAAESHPRIDNIKSAAKIRPISDFTNRCRQNSCEPRSVASTIANFRSKKSETLACFSRLIFRTKRENYENKTHTNKRGHRVDLDRVASHSGPRKQSGSGSFKSKCPSRKTDHSNDNSRKRLSPNSEVCNRRKYDRGSNWYRS